MRGVYMRNENASAKEIISVIVPVYKVEPYLRTCIDSILNQTYQDFELILIDDGSPDNCGAICDEYAAKDERIIVLHQENAGLSAARNAGLDWVFDNSGSEWITFVDSDDLVAPTMFTELIQNAQQYSADVVSTLSRVFTDESQLEDAPIHVVRVEKMTGAEACRSIYNRSDTVAVPAWGKLFKRDLIRDFRFPVGKVHERVAMTTSAVYSI